MALVKTYHPTRTVWKIRQPALALLTKYKNGKQTAMIDPVVDPDGNAILSKAIVDNPEWFDVFNSPEQLPTGKPVTDYLTEIPHCYWEDDGQGEI